MDRQTANILAAELEQNRWVRVGCVMTYPASVGGESFVTVQSRRNPNDIRHIHSPREALEVVAAMRHLNAHKE